jgi:hypothetical protein
MPAAERSGSANKTSKAITAAPLEANSAKQIAHRGSRQWPDGCTPATVQSKPAFSDSRHHLRLGFGRVLFSSVPLVVLLAMAATATNGSANQ